MVDVGANQNQRQPRRSILAASVLVTSLWVYLFWPVVTGEQILAYRDTASHYYPLFQLVDRQWEHGIMPLWNRHEDLGRPLVANPTASVFYPGKIIFHLWFLPFASQFGIYVCAHVLIAAAGAYWAARVFRCTRAAATLAAISFAFGAPVLFQTCNVVYLVAASWLPWALGALWQLRRSGRRRSMVMLGIVLSMMVLGGDPQSAYHVGLIACAVLVFRFCCRGTTDAESSVVAGWSIRNRLFCWVALIVVGIVLSAIQILPSAVWSTRSFRSARETPRNIYEAAVDGAKTDGAKASDIGRGLFGQPIANTHHDHVYQYSYPPWMMSELFWPNFHGRMFPRYERWSDGLPGADMTWIPSVFCGSLVFLLGFSQLRISRKRDDADRFLSWLILLFGIGSLGWYGVGWLLDEVSMLFFGARGPGIGHPVGGIYWAMVNVLPAYVSFRYPAKLTVVFAVALTLLAARALSAWKDHSSDGTATKPPFRSINCLAMVLALASLVSVAGTWIFESSIRGWMESVAPDPVFGKLQVDGALWGIRVAALHGLVMSLLMIVIVYAIQRKRLKASVAAWIIVLVTATELLLANSWMVSRSSRAVLDEGPDVPHGIQRWWRSEISYPSFAQPDAMDRMARWLVWKQSTLHPKHHLPYELELVGSYSSVEPLDWMIWKERGGLNHTAPRRAMAIDGFVDSSGFGVFPEPLGRTRLVYECQGAPPIDESSIDAVRERTDLVLGHLKETAGTGVVLEREIPFVSSHADSNHHIIGDKIAHANRMMYSVENRSRGLLVIAHYYDPGWKAEIRSEGTTPWQRIPVHRANRIMMALELPPGKHKVRLVYRPVEFYAGAVISLVGWLTLFVAAFINRTHLINVARNSTEQ